MVLGNRFPQRGTRTRMHANVTNDKRLWAHYSVQHRIRRMHVEWSWAAIIGVAIADVGLASGLLVGASTFFLRPAVIDGEKKQATSWRASRNAVARAMIDEDEWQRFSATHDDSMVWPEVRHSENSQRLKSTFLYT